MSPDNPLGKLKPALYERFDAELAPANVYAQNIRSLALELCAKLASVRGWSERRSFWQERIARNNSFQQAAAERLSRIEAAETPRTVMAYSYMALRIFRLAR